MAALTPHADPAPGRQHDALVLRVDDLRKRYDDVDALAGVDFTASAGEVLCLLGPNGAGKTTTIEILGGLRTGSSGEVRVLGVDPASGDQTWRARLGIVLQSWHDHMLWRVRELLAYQGRYYTPYSTPEVPRPYDVDELLDTVGLTEHAHKRISKLSGGQRRRLDVALGIIGRAELLLLDEPTAGFDPAARRDFHDLVHKLADQQITVLLTTHDLDEAEKLADRVLILAGGRVIAGGSPDELTRRVSFSREVRWTQHGERHVHSTDDATGFLRDLLAQSPDPDQPDSEITELEVRQADLEDAYLRLVGEFEAGHADRAIANFPDTRSAEHEDVPADSGAGRTATGLVPSNPRRNAARAGLARGWILFRQTFGGRGVRLLQGFFMPVALTVALYFMRDITVPGTGFSLSTMALPGILGTFLALGMLKVASGVSVHMRPGELLRAKATPNGAIGHFVGAISLVFCSTTVAMVVFLILGSLVIGGLAPGGLGGWLAFVGIFALGMVAVLPLGAAAGSVGSSPRSIVVPVLILPAMLWGLIGISGIFYPITALPTIVQWIAQVFPVYWLGLGMRAALLPGDMVVAEIGESWRHLETIGVLGLWAIVGLVAAPILFRRMVRGEPWSPFQARRPE